MKFVILKVRNPLLLAFMYCFEETPLHYRVFAWIMGLTNLDQQTLLIRNTAPMVFKVLGNPNLKLRPFANNLFNILDYTFPKMNEK